MNAEVLIQTIKSQLLSKGFAMSDENEAFIDTLTSAIIEHIQKEAIVQVATTGTANAQSGVGKIK